MEKYDVIGDNYNVTRKADVYITQKLFEHLTPKREGLYLDIGCGTGNYTYELHKMGVGLIGIDPSKKMIIKAKSSFSGIDWKLGSAEKTDLNQESVDGIIAILTIHHWTDLKIAFSEMFRVLKPKGRMVIFTSSPKQMKGYWLNHYFPKMLEKSIKQMPDLEYVERTMNNNGLKILKTEQYDVHPSLQDKFLYCGKNNPGLYFDEQIRNGISSFSSLSNKDEIRNGLRQLDQDIENGTINMVMKSYANNFGDYLFIIGEKQG